jgi:hypothetical protein
MRRADEETKLKKQQQYAAPNEVYLSASVRFPYNAS